jgi:NADPH-dependent curcumin reductase CurA
MSLNRRILLAERPEGAVSERTFRLEAAALPALAEGELLVKNLCLSIDPTIRGWIERDTYLPAVKVGEVVRSGGIGEVVESKNAAFKPGDRVFGLLGWQEYSVHGAKAGLNQVPAGVPLTDALGVLGVTGITAYFGLLDIGKPEAGQTVVVSGAAGATGSVAGQIAKLRGCHVVGIAGRADKCRWITEELGFDAAIDYKTEHVTKRIFETCPKGVDVFFDNVGGPILDAVLANLALRARVVLCGAISQYNQLDAAYGPKNYVNLIGRRARMEGFIVLDYRERYMEAVMQLAGWVAEGKIRHKVHVLEGLERAPEALKRLFSGDHDGKLLVQLA